MKRGNRISSSNFVALCLGAIVAFSLLSTIAFAQASGVARAAGDLTVARQVTVNGTAARLSGMTIYSNNRLKTGAQGGATVSLGRRGRVELGANTELLLQFGDGSLGGSLQTGRLVMSLPAGVALALSTAKGLVKSDGLEATVVSVESANEKMKVVAHLGQAKIITAGKTETVSAGEEVALGSAAGGTGWQHRRLVAASLVGAGSAVGAASLSQAASQTLGPVAVNARPAASLTSLINSGINFSLAQILAPGGDPQRFFDTTIVCRDNENFFCGRRSTTTP